MAKAKVERLRRVPRRGTARRRGPAVADPSVLRERPPGLPVFCQRWDRLLFLHWPVEAAALRAHLPEGLELDTFDGAAWLSITPFTMPRMHPPHLPPVPVLGWAHEVNVRTYVHAGGVPGIFFLSIDANNLFAVLGARLALALPYHRAAITFDERDGVRRFHARRSLPHTTSAEIEVEWRLGAPLPQAAPGTLDSFLVERYCLYTVLLGALRRVRIFHPPWPLARAEVIGLRSTLLGPLGLEVEGEPLVHAQREPLDVPIWPPETVRV